MGTDREGHKHRLTAEGRPLRASSLVGPRANDFRVNVKWLAARRGFSIRRLALRSGVSERTLHNVLQGHTDPAFATMVLLAETLSVPLSDMLLSPLELRAKIPEGHVFPTTRRRGR